MFSKHSEKGQAIILIVIAMVGLVAMAALVVDGGNAYLNRRNAQTAADSAALAGAYERCVNKGTTASIEEAIVQYALTENKGTTVEALDGTIVVVPDPNNPANFVNGDFEVEVIVSITRDTFFAKVFGQGTSTVRATASAGCFPPGAADSVLPVAWSCRPPLPGIPSDSPDCEWKSIPWPVMQDIIDHPSFIPTGKNGTVLYDTDGTTADSYLGGAASGGDLALYLIMDSIPSSAEIPCIQTDPVNGTVDCDIDGDGRIDILGQGNRSWLILDGDANNAQLDDIIRGELDFAVGTPTWYPGREGAIADVYKDAKAFIEGTPALIPVFESFCSPTSNPMTDPLCEPLREPTDGLVQISTAASSIYFRVISFAEFYVTCVSNKLANPCPGKELAVGLGIIDKSTPSIEGYFIDGWASTDQTIGSGSTAIDLGIYVISLTE